VLSRPIELYTCAHALRPAIFGTQKEYSVRYCAAKQGRWGWDDKGSSNLLHLSAVLAHCLMVRREKRAVLSQLPPKLRQAVSVEIDAKSSGAIARRLAEIIKHGGGGGGGDDEGGGGGQHNPMLTEVCGLTGEAKVNGVVQHVLTTLEASPEVKLLLFGHHQAVLDALEAALLEKAKVVGGLVRIDGRTPTEHRQPLVDRFQSESSVRVALLSINAAGVGLTLTAASLVIFAELSWNVAFLLQVTGCHGRSARVPTCVPRSASGVPVTS
jgi:SWI/SNF-related matrix-associated actin-dependent regulator 1 of chromatin subfamily A